MSNEKYVSPCARLRQTDLVSFLACLGFHPIKIRTTDYWYLSPLRTEKTPSFKVNRRLNVWYDHGLGKGGNLVDFGLLYYACSVKELLRITAGQKLLETTHTPVTNQFFEKPNHIIIQQVQPLTALTLLRYLHQRNISIIVADSCCQQVNFELNGKLQQAIGFANDAGGWELRNPYFKGSSAPKTFTTLTFGAPHVAVFEGFFNYLSFLQLHQKTNMYPLDFVVLNSLSFFESARPFMEQYKLIHLYLDRDKTGQAVTAKALAYNSRYRDESRLYRNYKDFNEWITAMGKRTIN